MGNIVLNGLVIGGDGGLIRSKVSIIKNQERKVLKIIASALNHRDVWITKGMYPDIKANVIMGSDGLVLLDEKKYLINPGVNWGDNERVQSGEFSVLGIPENGTFCDQIQTTEDGLVEKPLHLTDHEAAALPLAGLTAYRTLFERCGVKQNDTVLINGVGGGVAMMSLLFAVALGCKVYVTSSSEIKIGKAIELGALGGYSYKDELWVKKFLRDTEGADVIIDSAGGSGFMNLVKITKPGASIGFYGGSGNWQNVNPRILFWRQINLVGSTMGSSVDFRNMISFVNKHKIKPVVDSIFDFKDYKKAFERMEQGRQFGKIVLDHSSLH